MLGIILTVYAIAFFAYWGVQTVKALPTIIKWILIIIAIPVLVPVVMIKSLPEYFKKDGKWYRYRWTVYLAFFFIIVDIILFSLPL